MIYLELFMAFLQIGLFSFGGAYGAIPLIRDVVLAHEWLDDEVLTYMIAISESTPGPIMVNMATYIGSSQGGLMGAFLATLGVILPSFGIILLITAILNNITKNKYFQAVLRGLKPCVIGIILATGIQIMRTNIISDTEGIGVDYPMFIILILLVLIKIVYNRTTKKKLSPIAMIVVAAFMGIAVFGIL